MVSNVYLQGGFTAASILSQSSSRGGIDFVGMFGSSGSSGSGTMSLASVDTAIQQADKNEKKQLAQVAKDPIVQKEIARYTKVVKNAKTLDEVLDDPVARKVFLKANGLGSEVDHVALAKKALASDPTDDQSVANKLAKVNGNWLAIAKTYNFELFGVGRIKTSDSIKEVTDNYVSEKRLDMLDEQMPGLGTVMLFKKIAANLDSPIKILGSAVGREVVTTALGLPKQIALQSVEAQVKAVSQRMDATKLKSDVFVDKLVQRYLVQLNGGSTGSIA
jgi:hypothetical protein